MQSAHSSELQARTMFASNPVRAGMLSMNAAPKERTSLNMLRDNLMKKKVEDQRQEGEKPKQETGKQEENMYSTPLTLIKIGNRAHGDMSYCGARVDRDGPADHAELDDLMDLLARTER